MLVVVASEVNVILHGHMVRGIQTRSEALFDALVPSSRLLHYVLALFTGIAYHVSSTLQPRLPHY